MANSFSGSNGHDGSTSEDSRRMSFADKAKGFGNLHRWREEIPPLNWRVMALHVYGVGVFLLKAQWPTLDVHWLVSGKSPPITSECLQNPF
jgi:hypothetical protein